MGDYSRDSFRLTNVMHQAVTGESVSNPRHYVGLRVQQAVPVLDADLNELGDIARRSQELLVRDVIGDGVPGQGTGFAVGPLEADNDFALQPGALIVGGWQVINPAPIAYSQLPRFFSDAGTFLGTDLTTPAGDRTDIVYLYIWEAETAASGTNGDSRLVNDSIGMETARRIERQWTVRVAQNTTDAGAIGPPAAGHKHYPLAKLFRSAAARIQLHMIEDLRRLGLSLADGIRSQMFLQRGAEIVDPARFSSMLKALRDILRVWQENSLFPIVLVSWQGWMSYLNALNEIFCISSAAEVNSDTRNLDNAGGLTVLAKLADAQQALIGTVRNMGTGVPAEMAVVDLYEDYINGSAAKSIAGIRPALTSKDLLGAVKGQEDLNIFLGLGTGELPQGNVTVVLKDVQPATAVTTGPMTLTYEVTSLLAVPATAEQIDLKATVSDVRWAISLDKSQLSLAPGASGTVTMTVDPADTLVNGNFADINLVASVHRRPSIVSPQTAQRFTIGQLPPGGTFFFYSGSPLQTGVLRIGSSQISLTEFDIQFTLVNSTGGLPAGEKQGFDVAYELIFPTPLQSGVTPADWTPAPGPITMPNQAVSGASAPVAIALFGQDLTGIASNVSLTVRVTATLTHINDGLIGGGKSATVNLPVEVVIGQ